MTRLIPWAALAALAFILAACSGGNGTDLRRVEQGKSITVLRSDKSPNLDPHSSSSGGDVRVLSLMYEHLVSASVGTDEVHWEKNGLAEDWTINDNHTVYAFRIRKGIKFHDGSLLDAHVVKKSLDRMVVADHPARPLERPYRDSYFADIKSVTVTDDHTVVITHNSPNPRFLGTLGLHGAMIVSPRAIDYLATLPIEQRKSWLTSHPAGTGPYTIETPGDYKSEEDITLTAFAEYHGGKPRIERVVFQTQKEMRVRTQRILAGDVHFIDSLDPPDWKRVDEDPKLELYTWQGQNLCYLAMNCNPQDGHLTSNRDIREAIALAIDRAPMVAKFAGRAKPQHVLIPPGMLGHPTGYRPAADTLARDEALQRARALVKGAGAEGKELKMFYPDEPRPYLLYSDEFANFIQQQVNETGLKLVLDKAPLSELTSRVNNGVYPLVLIGWMGDTGEPHNFWAPLLSGVDGKPAGNNNARFFNSEVAAKVDAAGAETDPKKRAELYYEIEKWVHNEFRPIVPLVSAEQSYAWVSSLKGVEVDSTGTFRFHKAYFED
jgi:peptide/nickel transport system substrate-binding protein